MSLKSAVEKLLLVTGARRSARRLGGKSLILAFHNVLPNGVPLAGDQSLHLDEEKFLAFMRALKSTWPVVSLREITSLPYSPEPRVAITFDDAYVGALGSGVAVLEELNLPATVFVCPGMLGETFWWDAFSSSSGLDPATRDHALDELAGRDEPVRTWAATQGLAPLHLPAEYHAASAEQLDRVASHPGIDLGVHTWGHAALDVLPVEAIHEELVRCRTWLEDRYSRVVPWVAYPYGRYANKVREAVRDLGFEGGLGVSGGWFSPDSDRLALPRLNIPRGLSLDGFRLRLAGMLSHR